MHVPLLVHVHVHVILEGAGGQFGQLGSIGHCLCVHGTPMWPGHYNRAICTMTTALGREIIHGCCATCD